ncbi:MAG: succinyl-diaminopimelate desuccinylase [Paracoccaceae bacterium]
MRRKGTMVGVSNAVDLSVKLIQCRSVTPINDGAIDLLCRELSESGFECVRVDRNGICNLFARWGNKNHDKTFGFNGHTDVVPAGEISSWIEDPFGGVVKDGWLYGRGAADMKTAVAAFVSAAIDIVKAKNIDGSIVITLTGDEEAEATDGTVAILDWMKKNKESMAVCLVGEPTCPKIMGDMIKIGRRGSVSALIKIKGVQGHVAYPARALNPLPLAAELVTLLTQNKLDKGTEYFDASTLAVTSIETGNTAGNVIPGECRIMVNIRFNDIHTSKSLMDWLKAEAKKIEDKSGAQIEVTFKVSGESFITVPGVLSDLVAASVKKITGVTAELSTSGGTSDARFIREYCPVVEFGLVGATLHQVNERVEVKHIDQLKSVYKEILLNYFK